MFRKKEIAAFKRELEEERNRLNPIRIAEEREKYRKQQEKTYLENKMQVWMLGMEKQLNEYNDAWKLKTETILDKNPAVSASVLIKELEDILKEDELSEDKRSLTLHC